MSDQRSVREGTSNTSEGERPGWRERLFGDRDRLGWWLVPMFVAVGLAGAVLAGSLAVVFASQRVDRLTRETAGARADLTGAAEDVREAADEALEAITAEVDAARDQLATELPYEDAAQAGVVHLVLETRVPDPAVSPAPARQEVPLAQEDGQEPPGDDPPAEDGPEAEPEAPAPQQRPTLDLRRRASGFVVALDGDTAFVATTFSLLVDPSRPDVPLDVGVRVLTAGGETTGRVHSWQASRDLLLLRVPLRGIDPMPWRPADEPIGAGDRITAVGLTPGLGAVRVGGTVAAVDANALISDLPALELLAGGPIVDTQGRVVAVGSGRYSPFGSDPVAVPVRLLCGDLLARCPD